MKIVVSYVYAEQPLAYSIVTVVLVTLVVLVLAVFEIQYYVHM